MRERSLTTRVITWGLLAVAGLGAFGCGESSSVTGPGRAIANITVASAADLVLIGSALSFQAIAAYSDGTTTVVSPSWSSDAPSVMTIDQGTGTARAVGSGQATISADLQGRHASKVIRSIPDFAGTFNGQLQHTAVAPGRSPGCAGAVGSTSALELSLVQSGDTVQGSLTLAGVAIDVKGSIAVDGTLSLSGERWRYPQYDRDSIADWRTSLTGDALTGTYTWTTDHDDNTKGLQLVCRSSDTLVNVVKTPHPR